MTKVWDGFIRGFHWLLVTGIVLLYVSGEQEWMDLHFVTGYLLLALFVARLIWGVVGSDTAKISNLFHGPSAVKQALKHEDKRYGHNAAGSYMVLLFFVLIAVQLISGLMSTDDIMMEGPLVAMVPSSWVEIASDVHHLNINLLIAAIALHVLAIVVYRLRGKNLVKTLVTGRTTKDQTIVAEPKMRAGVVGYVIFGVLSAVLMATWGSAPLSALFN